MRRAEWLPLVCSGFAAIGLFSGCGQKSDSASANGRPAPVLSVPGEAPVSEDARLHQPFAEAVSEESPGNQQVPPDKTMAGLPTGKVRLEVQKAWAGIGFTSAQGKPIVYLASINTDFGSFRVQLKPESAPNHVRNFIALARAGYYNGLTFEQLIQQQGEAGPESNVELVEAGCPLGTGEPGIGHLGYWLRPEIEESLLHEPGSFGAYHDDDPGSACCRFYITLTKAPAMDGNFTVFGQVVEGLDVVRTISRQPRAAGTFQPEKPVTIRAVTIETQEVR